MYGSLDISTSGLVANRVRLETISTNILNQDTILDAQGQYAPFQRRIAILAAGDPASGSSQGVHVSHIEVARDALVPRLEPDSPFADEEGMVWYPDINPVVEQMNAMEAMRAYEANIAVVEGTKSMISAALELLA
ncbi:MAG: flagellar basal body rod protein FlgC [Phycisphaerae bacterium]|nr:flagellar basal body rod protein FlgC [Phycisphaerae bacterium]